MLTGEPVRRTAPLLHPGGAPVQPAVLALDVGACASNVLALVAAEAIDALFAEEHIFIYFLKLIDGFLLLVHVLLKCLKILRQKQEVIIEC